MGGQAFDAKRLNGFFFDPEAVVLVGGNGPNDIPREDAEHLYDPRVELPPDEGMVKNMMVYGVVEPIIITKLGQLPIVVDGRQRAGCLREANKRLVAEGKEPFQLPAVLKKATANTLFGVMVSANENRLDDDQITRAEKLANFLGLGHDEEAAAITFHMTKQNVKQLLKLLELHPDVQKMVKDKKLSASAAAELIDLSPKEQVSSAKSLLENGQKPTANRVRKSVGKKPVLPTKRIVKKLMSLEDRPTIAEEHDTFWAGVQFMIGELSAKDLDIQQVIEELQTKTPTPPKPPRSKPAKKKGASKKEEKADAA